ncbi:MAG TPA: hypothetical protein VFB93_02970 [Burkholderiales bacterium]|nr:hypothetical protein [Burkholderiales bacterium]
MVTDRELYVNAISTAIDYYGFTDLARILNVNADDLDQWSQGKSRPPADVFFRIIDLTNQRRAKV